MKTFLEELAAHIWARYAEKTDALCIVLPNKRAGLYLKRFIAREAGKAIWAPRIVSIEQLISERTGLRIADHLTLISELYEVHRTLRGETADSFTDFMHWGGTLLHDFNDTDLYLADAKQLFSYLDASRALTLWNPDGRPLSEFQQNYLGFYQSLYSYYTALRERLDQRQWAYPGYAFRKAALNPVECFGNSRGIRYLFAGFNALTPAEEKIIRYLIDEGNAECIWDADAYYLDDPRQEAGHFLRSYRETLSKESFRFTGTGWSTPKNIHITGIAGHVGQAKVCGQILQSLPPEEITQTCVVLADESLLLPVLNAIPESITTFNITMGFPLSQSPLHSLLGDILSLHENAARLQSLYGDGSPVLLAGKVLSILQHPYVISWAGPAEQGDASLLSLAISRKIRESQQYYMSQAGLEKEIRSLSATGWGKLALLFGNWSGQGVDVPSCLESLLLHLQEHYLTMDDATLEREYIFQYLKLLTGMRSILTEYAIPGDLPTTRLLLAEAAGSATLPFYGEPLSGLQIMGVLETRNLDFKNVIVLSVNDDILPGNASQNSYIPHDIRNDFGLPSYKQREAVFSYHFYRLLQRCDRAWLLHNTQPGNLGSGEKSRFLAQLQHELPRVNPLAQITEEVLSVLPALQQPSLAVSIEKTPGILERIADRGRRGFAPSSINAYLDCPLRFYFSEILNLTPEEEATASMDAATLGTTLHNTLEKLYRPYVGQVLTYALIDKISAPALPLLHEEFRNNLRGSDPRFGKNLLLARVAETYLQTFLQGERARSANGQPERMVEAVEQSLSANLRYGNTPEQTVLIKGRVDRIDRIGESVCIYDYKTGHVDEKELKWADLTALLAGTEKSKSIQLITYAWLYGQQHPDASTAIESGIISFRALKKGPLALRLGESTGLTAKVLQEFETWLSGLLSEIFDPTKSFVQTSDEKKCEYCKFRLLCYR